MSGNHLHAGNNLWNLLLGPAGTLKVIDNCYNKSLRACTTYTDERESAQLYMMMGFLQWSSFCHCHFNSARLQRCRWPVSFQGQTHQESEPLPLDQEVAVCMSWISPHNLSSLCLKGKCALPLAFTETVKEEIAADISLATRINFKFARFRFQAVDWVCVCEYDPHIFLAIKWGFIELTLIIWHQIKQTGGCLIQPPPLSWGNISLLNSS